MRDAWKVLLEEGNKVMLDFSKLQDYFIKEGLREKEIMPVVVQNAITKEVLILAYVNKQALEYSLRNGVAAFWSTSRNELWVKGLTSGCTLKLIEVRVNCEQNSLLYLVEPVNNSGACHTFGPEGYRISCYYRKISSDGKQLEKIKREE
jgi:phosphoribosyl-AMP cyclohydrolase